MTRTFALTVMLAVMAGALLPAQTPGGTEAQFRRAQHKEEVEGDLRGAIDIYKTLAAGRDRGLAARSLLRMGEVLQKLGNAEAGAVYERIVRDFSDQSEVVAAARGRIAGLTVHAGTSVTVRTLARTDGMAGTVSSDGRYLSFSPWADGELYLRDVSKGTDRVLTRGGDFNVGASALSRDARYVAYQSYGLGCTGKQGDGAALCLLNLGDPGIPAPKTLVANRDIAEIQPMDWSPDGRTIAVGLRREDRTAQVALVNTADGSLRVLKSVDWRGPFRIAFSPDGNDLAFDIPVSDTTDDRDILIIAADGSRGSTVVEHPSQDVVMGWAPDGSALLFASDRSGSMSLWAQPIRDRRAQGARRLLRGSLGSVASAGITRDGALFFTVNLSERDIWITSLDRTPGRETTMAARVIRQFVGTNAMPAWSSDGRLLAYSSQRAGARSNAGRVIGIRDMKTGEERALRPQLTYFASLSWAPDGSALLTGGTDFKGRTGVFLVDARSGEASLVVEGIINAAPQWSSDGSHVFYRKGADQQFRDFEIVERDLRSGAERTVTRGEIGFFSVSPDGRSIAATVGGLAAAFAQSITRFRVDTGQATELLRAGAGERLPPYIAPRWMPDGGVLVHKRTPHELWLVPPAGPARKLDIDVRDWSFGSVAQIAVHPDGRQIAFLAGAVTSEVTVLEHAVPVAPAARGPR